MSKRHSHYCDGHCIRLNCTAAQRRQSDLCGRLVDALVRVKKDGTELCEAGKVISLDMTVIHWNGEYYAAWSERQFVPIDLGAWIYIAKLDPKAWKLTSDPVLLTKPILDLTEDKDLIRELAHVSINVLAKED